ncbi:MAG: hypothetical protein QF406_02980 [Verrucomicrobiota bacterium]|jgi:hypothetical protein|nr:hypothetical protein [Verrucomicrobiota bacterium]
MNRQKHEKGAVLIVALVMLAMVTFLVVAFVGFARFERASVTASMRQTEATFASQDAMAIASGQIIDLMTNGLPFGLRVSERTNFNQFVPVYIDTNGDGKQDRNSTYLNLNFETNRIPNPLTPPFDDAFGFQDANHTVNQLGDPEWIGILKDSSRPHGPDNRFVARTAFMTVPLSRSLNVRYHHVKLNPVASTYGYERRQGLKPGEINLAAPLYHIDPGLFSLPKYNPQKYANAFHGLGSGVVDAMHYSRPSVEFNRNLGKGFSDPTGTPVGKLSYDSANTILDFQQWFSHPAHRNASTRFYRFMETFSAAELPVEDNRFDVSTIRDQPIDGYAFTVDMGESDTIVFLDDHPFSSGDKVGVTSQVSPNIWDPIDWKKDPATLADWQQLFASGGGTFDIGKPHKLLGGERLEVQVPAIDKSGATLRLLERVAPGVFQPLPVMDVHNPSLAAPPSPLRYLARSTSANEELDETSIEKIQFCTSFLNSAPSKFEILSDTKHFWGTRRADGVWEGKYQLDFDPIVGDAALPPQFTDQMLVVRYRNTLGSTLSLDPVPYYVKVISKKEVSLHRSPLLDNFSRVNFVNPVGGTPAIVTSPYNTSNKCFMNSSFVMPFSSSNSLEWEKDLVRFTGATMPVDISTGKTFTDQDVFIVKKPINLNPTDNLFQLRHILAPALRIDFKGSGPYQLQRVHRFTCDKLTESVEKMAGAMLNESIDVEGPGATASVKVGGESIGSPPLFPLRLGIGAHHLPLGPWHVTQMGIPWNQGSYSPEIERIIQVAANIGDLYSGYYGPNLKVGPRENVTGGSNVNGPVPNVLSFGEYSREAHIQATITQINKGPHGRPGLVLCYRTDLADPYNEPYYRIRYTDHETSRTTPGGLTEVGFARIELLLDNGTLLAQSGEFREYSGPFELEAACERGREVKVYLDGKLVIHHEHTEPLAGQAGLMVANGNWSFTNISPSFFPYSSSTGKYGLPGSGGWGLPPRDTNSTTQHGDIFPTAYQGVFNRDEFNNTYLTGLQRVTQLGASSWYQRGAPKVIGVKDRYGSYAGRMPALNEVSLRVAYDRNNNMLRGKLSAEVDVPKGYFVGSKIKISNLKLSGERVATYYPDLPPETELFSQNGGIFNNILSREGYVTYAFNSWFDIASAGPRAKSGAGPVPSSLSDIQLQNLQLRMNVEISKNGQIIDFFEGVLSMPQSVSLGNPAQDPLYAPVWNQTKAGAGGYQVGTLVLDPTSLDYYRVESLTTVKPEPGASGWKEMKNIMRYRKIDVSWQVNDPLVNSSERGWQGKVYAVKDFTDGTLPPASPVRGDGEKRIWSPGFYNETGIKNNNDFVYPANPSLSKHRLQARLGGNLCARNDKMLHWNAVDERGNVISPQDSSVQDPGVADVALKWWTFPDIHTRGGPQNAGWLGQVHRGTPWQTLYLKAKREPGSIKVLQINDASGEVTTAAPHNLSHGDTVSFTGTPPPEWVNGVLPAAVTGQVQKTAPNRFILLGADLDGDGSPDSELIGYGGGNAGFYAPADLYLDTQFWEKWAGSSDTRPVNDRRLIDALTVSEGSGMQGRFSINNPSPVAWSGLLHGLSLPKRQVLDPVGGTIYYNRILGANMDHPILNPFKNDRDNTLNTINSSKFENLVTAINSLRGTQVPLPIFSRASDILGVEELTDKSPYLTEIITGIDTPNEYTTTPVGAYWADDLDLERIPQQLMSLLKAGGRQYYQTYIFTEQLRPARKNNIGGIERRAVDGNRNVSNYEVAGQSARRVVFELIGASQWIESLKRGHFGQYRDQNGDLEPLAPLYPRVIQQYPLSLDN